MSKESFSAYEAGENAAVTDQGPHGGVGYSQVVNTPRFQAALAKNKRSNRGCAWIFCVLPFVILTLYSLFSDELDVIYGMALGGAASAVLLVIFLLSSLKDSMQKPWEGVVEQKYEKTIRRYDKHKDSSEDYYDEPHGIVVVRDDRGKKHKIDERLDATSFAVSYHYLKVGDRVRFHGIKGLSYPYEKYDKSKDEYVICAFCRRRAPIADSDCPHCHNPLLR